MARRTAPELIRAVGAVLVIAALLVGLPLVLVLAVGWPLPTALPSVDQLRDAGRSGVDPRVVLKVVAFVAWLAWAQLALALARELWAFARSAATPSSVLVLPGAQRLAARLVAAAFMVSSLVPSRVAVAAPIEAVVAVEVSGAQAPTDTAGSLSAAQDGHPAPAGARPAWGVPDAPRAAYRAGPRDTYWDIAERFLGDGRGWQRIRDLNVGRTMPDGATVARGSTLLRPGWVLLLPAEVDPGAPGAIPAGAADAAPHAGPEAATVVIEPHGHLWGAAERALADAWGRPPTDGEVAPYWRRLVEENRGRLVDPDNPDLVFAGQEFVLPPVAPAPPGSAATGSEDAGVAAVDEDERGAEGRGGGGDAAREAGPPAVAPEAATAGAPAPAGPTTGNGARSAAPAPPVPPAPPTTFDLPVRGSEAPQAGVASPATPTTAAGEGRDGDGRDPDQSAPSPSAGGLLAGGLVTAGLVGVLVRLRRAQQRRRRRARAVPLPGPEAARAEIALRAGADEDGARRLDLALRALSALAAPLDEVRWALVRGRQVELVTGGSGAAPVPPFVAGERPGAWVLPTSVESEALEALAAGSPSPVPTLVALGTTDDGLEVLVDAERLGVIAVGGPAGAARALVRDMALATAAAPWADDVELVVVGSDAALEALPWTRAMADLGEAVEYLRQRAEATEDALGAGQVTTPLGGRLRTGGDSFEPTLAVSVVAPSDEEWRGIEELAARANRGVALLVPAGDRAGGWRVELSDHGGLRVPGLAGELRPHLLDDNGALTDLLATAARTADVPRDDGAGQDRAMGGPVAPGESADVEARVGTPPADGARETVTAPVDEDGQHLVVQVLGEVEVAGPDDSPVAVKRSKSLEAVAYLAVHSHGVPPDQLEAALFPDGTTADKSHFRVVMSAARRSLGVAPDGQDYLPKLGGPAGLFRLGPRMTSDLARFRRLVGQAAAIAGEEELACLAAALRLVRGEPFGVRGQAQYAWCHGTVATIEGEVVDAAERLGELCLEREDPRGAEWAARQGLLASPYDERLYRLLMRAADAEGNPGGVEAVFRELATLLEDDVEPYDSMHPETVTLFEALTRRRAART